MIALPLQVLDSLSSWVLAADRENRVVFLNRALAARLGIEREHWLGRPVEDVWSAMALDTAASEPLPAQEGTLEDADAEHTRELRWPGPAGVRHLREDAGPLRDETGSIVGRLFSYHDLSREKAVGQRKSEFLAVAAHELRTPMTSVKGAVDLILGGFLGEISAEIRELLELAQQSCERLTRLINDILDLSKIEAGQMKLKLVPADLAELAGQVVAGLRAVAEQRQVSLALYKPETLPHILLDRDRIEQVLTNLVSNAIKFSPPKTEVRVEVSAGDGWVQCSVVDRGCGINQADLKRIFGKFQQVASSKSNEGTGLGLAVARAIVEEHRGKIWVESRLNQGSRFSFKLPVKT